MTLQLECGKVVDLYLVDKHCFVCHLSNRSKHNNTTNTLLITTTSIRMQTRLLASRQVLGLSRTIVSRGWWIKPCGHMPLGWGRIAVQAHKNKTRMLRMQHVYYCKQSCNQLLYLPLLLEWNEIQSIPLPLGAGNVDSFAVGLLLGAVPSWKYHPRNVSIAQTSVLATLQTYVLFHLILVSPWSQS